MYVVIGANGYLGSYVIKAILSLTHDNIIATTRDLDRVNHQDRVIWKKLNIQSEEAIDMFLNEIIDYEDIKMVYLAAYHHPDAVENNREMAWDINVTSLSKFLNKAQFVNKIFYASTDSVYGESFNGYHFKETDALNPVNFYGHNKCAAEALLLHMGRNIVRYPFLISPSIVYKPHFYDVIVNTVKSGKQIEMFEDSYRSSLSFENAGKLLVELIEKDEVPQIVNICGDKDLSKYEVALIIAEIEKINKSLIIPVSINKTQKNFETKRATSTLMDNSLLKSILGLKKIDVFKQYE